MPADGAVARARETQWSRRWAAGMQLTETMLEILPRVSGSVPGPTPRIAKRGATATSKPKPKAKPKPKSKPVAGAFIEITTEQKATRILRNRQLAATTLAAVKQTISKLESDNETLRKNDDELTKKLAEVLAAVAAKTTAFEA